MPDTDASISINLTWRSALGYCLRRTALSAMLLKQVNVVWAVSNDLATMLISLSAEICIRSLSEVSDAAEGFLSL